MAEAQLGPRARYREQTRAEIKESALRQLADGGVAALALTRIAKDMGLSGPALYRYFASRDDLLNALIRDAYDDAATAIGVAAARSDDVSASPRERLRSLAAAYRTWAVGEPHRYLLIQGSPVPGYVAPADTLDRARAVLGPFLAVFAGGAPGAGVTPVVTQMADWLASDAAVGGWVTEYAADASDTAACARALAGALLAWAQLHGSVGLEAAGQFTGMGHSVDTLLDAQIGMLADAFGLE
ncbi:TetR/AcrR family transcriptional regulator [Streptomyces sp. NBC_01260]|uniref:TetR/AcrR family transcriptional regulator n=1 Tax=unclassified Streptomyces TaxID=2593676 RepID=UPI000F550838|nr:MULTISPECIES: TetR/AcrR family transcriptional regulator [unclassified Streptomyces]MCX4768325.1 TetR/AcrR family transcriptional regulator [Streptomyces sp. NBC_01285]RPK39508.1 putative HTH-type transcriptional regulator [Streptomyces sp. ADI92-24]